MPNTNPANPAYITPQIIVWARQQHDISHEDLALAVGVHVNQIVKWEDGKTKPTFTQAINLANALKIPFGYLFLSKPPALEEPLPDLRTLRDRKKTKLSADFYDLLYGVLNQLDWYREYREGYGAEKLAFIGKFSTQDDRKIVAADIRETIGINEELRGRANTLGDYLTLLTTNAEAAGVLVMRSGVVGNDVGRSLSVDEFQGFAITDDLAPVIFINSQDYIAARIFTLTHELIHLWIGQSGISKPDELEIPGSHVSVETFCNAVAAEVLVPETEFLNVWETYEGAIFRLATHFRVSRLVILRRAFELGRVTREYFFTAIGQMQYTARRRGGGRGDYLVNVANRHSPKFTDSVIADVRTGGTLYRDGARLLHMRLPTFMRLVQGGEF